MTRLYSPKKIKEISEKYKFRTSKSLGQNFLIDGNVVRKIREDSLITKDDTVLEVGPGIGTLTEELLLHAKEVIAVELDDSLVPILGETLKEFNNFILINDDILKVDLKEILKDKKDVKVVANLPYYVTTPIISKFIESDLPIDSMTFMVQKEVGERMISSPGNKVYGSLSVYIQFYSEASKILDVKNTSFMPRPKIDSTVIHMKKKNFKEIYSEEILNNKEFFFDLVHAAFNQRRKTILNSMTSNKKLGVSKDDLRKVLSELSISEKLRAEDLSSEEYIKITEALLK